MNNEKRAIQLARLEVIGRNQGMTAELLDDNEIETDKYGKAVLSRVDTTREAGAFFLYFPIAGQSYSFVIVVRPDEAGELEVDQSYLEPGVQVRLILRSLALAPAEISRRLGVTATESRPIQGSPTAGSTLMPRHEWVFEPGKNFPAPAAEKIEGLLEAIRPAEETMKELRPHCKVELDVCYQAWAGEPSLGTLNFSPDALQTITSLGAELNIRMFATEAELVEV